MSKVTKIIIGLTDKQTVEITGKSLIADYAGDLTIEEGENSEVLAVFADGHWHYWRVLEKIEDTTEETES